jgi:hypothetical protein
MPKRQSHFFSAVTHVIVRNFTNEALGIVHVNWDFAEMSVVIRGMCR